MDNSTKTIEDQLVLVNVNLNSISELCSQLLDKLTELFAILES